MMKLDLKLLLLGPGLACAIILWVILISGCDQDNKVSGVTSTETGNIVVSVLPEGGERVSIYRKVNSQWEIEATRQCTKDTCIFKVENENVEYAVQVGTDSSLGYLTEILVDTGNVFANPDRNKVTRVAFQASYDTVVSMEPWSWVDNISEKSYRVVYLESKDSSRLIFTSGTDVVEQTWVSKRQSFSESNEDISVSSSLLYDSLEDQRDGKKYSLVKIGNKIWMGENIRYTDSGDVGYCYNGAALLCSISAVYSLGEINETGDDQICPARFRVSTDEDWTELEMIIGLSADEITSQATGRGAKAVPLLIAKENNFFTSDNFGNDFSMNLHKGAAFYQDKWFDKGSYIWTPGPEEYTGRVLDESLSLQKVVVPQEALYSVRYVSDSVHLFDELRVNNVQTGGEGD